MAKMTNLEKWKAAFDATSCNVIREGVADGVKKIRDAEGNVIRTEDVHIPYTTRENEVVELGTCNNDDWRDEFNKVMKELGFPEGFDPQVKDGWTKAHATIENFKKEDSKIGLQGLTPRQSGPAFAVETMGLILDVVTGTKVFAGIVILGSEEDWKDNIHFWKAINNTVLPDCDRYITRLCKRFNLDEAEIRNRIVIAHSLKELFSDELPEEAAK